MASESNRRASHGVAVPSIDHMGCLASATETAEGPAQEGAVLADPESSVMMVQDPVAGCLTRFMRPQSC